jgi:hypothetical protein
MISPNNKLQYYFKLSIEVEACLTLTQYETGLAGGVILLKVFNSSICSHFFLVSQILTSTYAFALHIQRSSICFFM